MLRRLSAGLLATAAFAAPLTANAQENSAEGLGVMSISNGLTAGVNVSYDEAFDTRVSADINVRFGDESTTAQHKEVQQLPVINALASTPSNRDVRAHDYCYHT